MTNVFFAALSVGFYVSVSSMVVGSKPTVSPTLCSASVEKGGVTTGSCSSRGIFRCGVRSGHYEFCNGKSWLSMCPCATSVSESVAGAKSSLGTRGNPGRSCDEIFLGGGSHGDGAYWISPEGSLPYEVYCDMTTAGGGWTLVAKVKGNNHIMNRLNTAQWRDGRLIGFTTALSDENALGLAYGNLPFRDVMIRSIRSGENHVAWRHPSSFDSMQKIVQNCERIYDGVKISGDISLLDYNGDAKYHNPCTELVYGFMGGETNGALTPLAGCTGETTSTHVASVVGAFMQPPSGERSRPGQSNSCITSFGLGSGYHKLSSQDDKYAINAHWWGKGNDVSHNWNTHALFLR
ncbi:uncharacterized protein [Oscarella lobularis]|uniref:uncharacterized protein n=1 Tax=Oscarella lobularis TaxID=121494 RepID=UPI00331425CF